MGGLLAQFLDACAGVYLVETARTLLGQLERALVILERELALSQLVEADGEIEGIVRVFRVGRVGLEILRLGIIPARLLGVLIAEDETQMCRLRPVPDQG